jgi:hypothetical protein
MITTIGSDYALTAGDTISFAASNSVVFHSDSNLSMSALAALTGTGDSQVLFWSASNKLELDPASATLSAGNLSSIDVSSTGILIQTPEYQATASTSFQVSAPAVSFVGSNISLEAVTSTSITASNIQLQSTSGDQLITLDDSTGVILDSSKRVELVASDATGSAGSVVIDGLTHSVKMSSLTADSNVMSFIQLADSNITGLAAERQRFYVGATATGTPIMELDSTGINAYGSQHDFFVTATDTPAVSVYRDVDGEAVLRVRGRLDIDGELNTINQTSINVADKTINLAYPETGSNIDSVVDGVTNDMAGIVVYGKPNAPAFSNAANLSDPLDVTERYYEKSMRWNNGVLGMDALGKSNGIDYTASSLNESFWQVRGGHLQLTLPQQQVSGSSNVVRDTSFGFRINERGELELFKRHWENGSYKARRLVRWGHGNGLL